MNSPSELRYFTAQSMLVLMLKEAGEKQTARRLAKELVNDWRKAHGGEPVKSKSEAT